MDGLAKDSPRSLWCRIVVDGNGPVASLLERLQRGRVFVKRLAWKFVVISIDRKVLAYFYPVPNGKKLPCFAVAA